MADEKVMIPLSEIVELCKKYTKGEVSQEDMTVYGNKMVIKQYLSILDKLGITASIVLNHLYSDVDSQEVKTAELHKYMFFYGLLSGYAMIDCSDKNLVTFENYDLIYPIFAPFILSFCSLDYDNFKEFVKDSISFYQAKELSNNLETINPDVLEKAAESNKELIRTLEKNKDLIADIKELRQLDNPLVNEIAKGLSKNAIIEAQKKKK